LRFKTSRLTTLSQRTGLMTSAFLCPDDHPSLISLDFLDRVRELIQFVGFVS
jgi:hypothetical protein